MCQFEMVTVAGRQIIAGLGDADDRFAGLQLAARQAEIQITLEIERGHSRIMRVVEPFAGAKLATRACAIDRLIHDSSRTAHMPSQCATSYLGPILHVAILCAMSVVKGENLRL